MIALNVCHALWGVVIEPVFYTCHVIIRAVQVNRVKMVVYSDILRLTDCLFGRDVRNAKRGRILNNDVPVLVKHDVAFALDDFIFLIFLNLSITLPFKFLDVRS